MEHLVECHQMRGVFEKNGSAAGFFVGNLTLTDRSMSFLKQLFCKKTPEAYPFDFI